jgi:hypothetical protein
MQCFFFFSLSFLFSSISSSSISSIMFRANTIHHQSFVGVITNLVKSNVIHTIIVFFFFLSLLRFPHISIVLWQHIHHFHYHPHSNLCWRCSTEAICLFVSFVVLSLFLLSLFSSCCSFCYF